MCWWILQLISFPIWELAFNKLKIAVCLLKKIKLVYFYNKIFRVLSRVKLRASIVICEQINNFQVSHVSHWWNNRFIVLLGIPNRESLWTKAFEILIALLHSHSLNVVCVTWRACVTVEITFVLNLMGMDGVNEVELH